MLDRLYKLISFIMKSMIIVYALLNIGLYGSYRYYLNQADLSKFVLENKRYKVDFYAVLWSDYIRGWTYSDEQFNSEDIKVKPVNLLNEFAQMLYSGHMSSPDPSHTLQRSVVRIHNGWNDDFKLKLAIQIWLSYHFTFEELSDMFFKKAYYENHIYGLEQASQRYFNKQPNDLNIYEVITLQVLARKSISYRNDEELHKEINLMVWKLRENLPSYYGKLESMKTLPKSLVRNIKNGV